MADLESFSHLTGPAKPMLVGLLRLGFKEMPLWQTFSGISVRISPSYICFLVYFFYQEVSQVFQVCQRTVVQGLALADLFTSPAHRLAKSASPLIRIRCAVLTEAHKMQPVREGGAVKSLQPFWRGPVGNRKDFAAKFRKSFFCCSVRWGKAAVPADIRTRRAAFRALAKSFGKTRPVADSAPGAECFHPGIASFSPEKPPRNSGGGYPLSDAFARPVHLTAEARDET